MTGRASEAREQLNTGDALEEACLTCSDWAETYRLVTLLDDGRGLVDTASGTEEVSIALVDARGRRPPARPCQGGSRRRGARLRDEKEHRSADGVSTLYPFLHGSEGDLQEVLGEVTRSTDEKVQEIIALRRAVVERYEGRLLECAATMASSFAAGHKLLTFGNGGSSTDAQAVAQTFLDPPGRPAASCDLADERRRPRDGAGQ